MVTSLKRIFGAAAHAAAIFLSLGVAPAWAAPTSFELYGVLFDGDGNRVTGNGFQVSSALYDSAAGGSLLTQFAPEAVHVGNGNFLQVFSVDDSLFAGDAYLQLNINGFTMEPRLGVFYNLSYYFASGVTGGGPVGNTLFQLYAGLSAPPPIPEPAPSAMLVAGLAVLGLLCRRQRTV